MPRDRTSLSVLILDPHGPSRQVLLRYLHRFGLSGREAVSFNEAKALLGQRSHDAVACQCPLPDVAFVELMDWLRPCPDLDKRIYVLGITSMPEVFSRELLLQKGVDDCLVKPMMPEDTCQALMRLKAALKRIR